MQPRFALTASNVASVAQICLRLDGIPLALELAALRVDSLTPEQITLRLDQRFRLLTGGSRTALPRQQTLSATLDWSYDLLRKPECKLFERLAVFSGGWTLDAAEAVCAGGDVDAEDVLDLLAKLTRKSLVVAHALPDGTVRYALPETVREYAQQNLGIRGPAQIIGLRDKHGAFYGEWIEQQLPIMLTERSVRTVGGIKDALLRVDADYDNVRAMLNWCIESDKPASGIRACIRLVHYWESRGLYAEGSRWLGALLGLADAARGPDRDQVVQFAFAADATLVPISAAQIRPRHIPEPSPPALRTEPPGKTPGI